MKKNVKVSELDQINLHIIRKNVKKIIKEISIKYDKLNYKILDIAPQDHENSKKIFKNATLKTLDINPLSNADFIADICNDNSNLIKSNHFDLVICTEVLEHTLNPFSATQEIYRILKRGGAALISTPCNFRIHGPLPDCWRFTEHGLNELLKKFSRVKISEKATKNRPLFPVHYTVVAIK